MPPRAPKSPRVPKPCQFCGHQGVIRDVYPVGHHKIYLEELSFGQKKGCQICFLLITAVALFSDELLPPPAPNAPTLTLLKRFTKSLEPDLRLKSWVMLMARNVREPLELTARLAFRTPLLRPRPKPFPHEIHSVHPENVYPGDSLRLTLELFSEAKDDLPWLGIWPARHVAATANDKHRKKLLKEWTSRCAFQYKTSHALCWTSRFVGTSPLDQVHCSPEFLDVMPRRLLDLGGNPRNAVRLTTVHKYEHSFYATVSHCWSRSSPSGLRLTKLRLAEMEERIRWRDLPPSFQDAVTVAAEQKIQWLWIDALCVVQDDKGDCNWHVERMHHIYQNSLLNIALTGAASSETSSLGTRTPNDALCRSVRAKRINLGHSGRVYPIWVRPKSSQTHTAFCLTERLNVDYKEQWSHYKSRPSFPLMDRGWAMQQLLLAPRTVFFTGSELVWQCRSATWCECSCLDRIPVLPESHAPIGGPLRSYMTVVHMLRRRIFEHPPSGAAAEGSVLPPAYPSVWDVWRDFRDLFTHLHPEETQEQEKLQAMLGVAVRLEPLMGRAFVAGLWASTGDQLAEELVWLTEREVRWRPDEQPRRCTFKSWTGRRVPSWSWLSMCTDIRDSVRPFDARTCRRHMRGARDPSFSILQVSSDAVPNRCYNEAAHTSDETEEGTENRFNAENWTLRVVGRFVTAKLATRDRGLRNYQILPTNLQLFPPYFPPSSPPRPARQSSPPAWLHHLFSSVRNHPPNAPPRPTQTTIHFPPLSSLTINLPDPAPLEPDPGQRKLTHRRRADWLSPGQEQQLDPLNNTNNDVGTWPPAGTFKPDCDLWDDVRKATTGGYADHTYGYLLVVGQVKASSAQTVWGHVGLVLERIRAERGLGRDDAAGLMVFRRVGLFTAPRAFFQEAQKQEIMIR